MSESTQVVFAIDVASFYTHEDKPTVSDYQQAVNAVRYSCLKLLTYFGRERTRWGYKFYSSSGLTRQRMDRRPFREFNLDQFEEFEDELVQRLERYRGTCEAMGRAGNLSTGERDPPCAILRTAVTQVASDYPWDAPSMASPVRRRKRKRCTAGDLEYAGRGGNYLFNVSRCPRSEADMAFFLGRGDVTQLDGNDVADEMVPVQVRRLLVDSLSAKLVWIDADLQAQCGAHALVRSAMSRLGGDAVSLQALVGSDCAPFSALADLFLKGRQQPLPLVATAVTLDQELVGSVLFCLGAPPLEWCDVPRWREVRILARTRACAGARALNSRMVQVLRCPDRSAGADSSGRLLRILESLQRQGEVLFVELTSDLPARQYAFLSPLGSAAFCLQVVTEPPAFAKHWTVGRLPQSPTEDSDIGRCTSPPSDPVECCVQRAASDDDSSRRLPFRAASLEGWFVAPSAVTPFSGSDQHDSDEVCGDMLRRLRHSYNKLGCPSGTKEKNDAARSRSERLSRQSPRLTVRKSLSASLNPSGRSAGILAHSYADVQRAGCRERPPCSKVTSSSSMVPQNVSYANSEQLLAHLKESYTAALDSNLSTSLLTCAQNIVSVIKRFVESQPRGNEKQASVCEVLRTHFVLSCPQITGKYSSSNDDASQRRCLREYQLQALLALEEEVSFGPTGTCVERVTSLLRTLSLVHCPSVASEFLRGILRDTYLATLRDVLIEVGDELSVPLFSDDQDSLLGSEGDFGRFDRPASVTSFQSQDSYLSSIPSSFNSQMLRDNAESRPLARVDLSQPSSSASLSKRQIVVPRVPKRRRHDAKPVRTSPRKPEPRKVCRDLFTATTSCDPTTSTGSPQSRRRKVLKTTFVPETPSRRQGRRPVQRRQELLRRKSSVIITVPVIEETPEKRLLGAVEGSCETPSPFKSGNGAKTPEKNAVTPKRALRTRAVFSQETPPGWNGSESLFSSPEDCLSRSSCERTPAKTGLCSGVVLIGESPQGASDQRGGVTPRRRVSKKLLSSPSTPHSLPRGAEGDSPALKKLRLEPPSASQKEGTGSSPQPEIPRRLFGPLADSSSPKELDTGRSPRQNLANGASQSSLSSNSSAMPNRDSSQGFPVKERQSPVLTKLIPRFTRSKSKETGLSPHQLFLLSQASPVKCERQTEQCLHGASAARSQDPSATPSHRTSRKTAYTPPSALSLLHLTSSPMLLKK